MFFVFFRVALSDLSVGDLDWTTLRYPTLRDAQKGDLGLGQAMYRCRAPFIHRLDLSHSPFQSSGLRAPVQCFVSPLPPRLSSSFAHFAQENLNPRLQQTARSTSFSHARCGALAAPADLPAPTVRTLATLAQTASNGGGGRHVSQASRAICSSLGEGLSWCLGVLEPLPQCAAQ
jgi:hypothetical protein